MLPCAALVYAGDGSILAANRMAGELLGRLPDELAGLFLAELCAVKGPEQTQPPHAELDEGRRSELVVEKRLLSASGALVRCEVALKCIADGAGGRYLALLRRLSEAGPGIVAAPAGMNEEELILQAIDEGFILLDREFRIRRINEEALRIDGRPRSAILGRTHWEAWPGSEELPLADAYRRAMRERIQLSVEQLYRHDGQDMWIEARTYPFGDGLAVFYRNITERKRQEQALRESEARFRSIIDAIPQVVWSARPDGYHDYFNRQFYEYAGVAEGAYDGIGWLALYHPDDQARLMQRWQHSLETGEPYEIEYRCWHHSGRFRWTLGRALPIRDDQGNIVRWMGTCTDIDEQIGMQEQLRDTQARLEAALSAAEIGTWTWDIPANRLHSDRNLTAMFGTPHEQASGAPIDTWFDLIHPDDSGAVRASIAHALDSPEPYQARFRVQVAGGIRFMQARGTVERDAQGAPLLMSGAVLDVTREHLAEEARLLSESKFRTILQSDVIGIAQYRYDGTLEEVNDAFLKMLGYTRDHFERNGLSWRELTPPEWAEVDAVAWESLRATGRMEPIEKEYLRSDGSRMPAYIGAANFEGSRDEGICYVLDISEAKKSEAALRSSELTFRTLADNIPQLAWMADSSGEIFWYNSRWFAYTGTTLEEMRGWGWAKVHHSDHVERVVARYRRQIVEEQVTWEDTFPLRGADGRYRWFLSRAVPVRDQDGRVLRWLGTNTDVTLQREAEQAAQQANRRKDDFLAMLAHELRSPLAPISTAAQLLRMGASNPEYIKRSSDIIDRQVKHMSDLVNDIMDVSRVTRGLVSIEKKELAVTDIVHSAVEQSRPLVEARKQELVLDLRDGGAKVLGERTRLVQVLTNLLNNSAKYTQQGGRIELKVDVRGDRVDFIVADNGIGMDAALLPHVFELFVQAERTPDRSEGGLGLGLPLVKSIVALHGGRVTAHSAGRGMGSTFTVSLPLWQAQAAGAARQDTAAARPLRILLVDRPEEDAGLGAELQHDGHTVALCPDGPCALARARELHPDAVLVRTDLPGVDGYALARELRALHPDEEATYVALSDASQSHDKVIARGAGFDHQLERPVPMAALRKVLAAAPLH
jgi:PAS domain S-box-containing protein